MATLMLDGTSAGVATGRFARLNSWQVVTHPMGVAWLSSHLHGISTTS